MNMEVTTSLLFAMLATFVFAMIVALFWLMLEQRRRNEKIERQLLNMVFHSRFSDRRADVEASMINLGRELQLYPEEFFESQHLALRAENLREENSNGFLASMGINLPVSIKDRQVFVLTPFSGAEIETFAAIRSALQEANWTVLRGDESKRSDVFTHIVKSILEAQVVVANLNGRNPNVMYELGIAHALDKPVVLVAEVPSSVESIPFDLRSKSILLYDNLDELRSGIVKAILRVVSD